MPQFRTLLGDIDTKQMGLTLSHEHLITRPPNNIINGDVDLLVDDITKPVPELKLFKDAGGGTLIEMTPKHYGRNIPVMVDAAQKTGVHVVATTGYLKGAYFPPEIKEWTLNQIVDYMAAEVVDGMEGTPYKAGVIKGGTSYNYVSDLEEKVLTAAAIASQKTGAPVATHTQRGTMGVEQIEIVKAAGLDPSRIIIGHVDINLDYYYHRKMVSLGAYIVYDGPSKVKYGPDSARIEILRKLVSDGFANRILLSCDMGRRSYWTSYGGGPGFTYIPCKFIPRLLDEGFTQEVVHMFMVTNPANAFALQN